MISLKKYLDSQQVNSSAPEERADGDLLKAVAVHNKAVQACQSVMGVQFQVQQPRASSRCQLEDKARQSNHGNGNHIRHGHAGHHQHGSLNSAQ
jgi:hypothetical protein